MLTLAEKILFVFATLVSLYFTYKGVMKIVGHISSGQGKADWSLLWKRIGDLIVKVGLFQPVFRFRLGPSILHALIGWGFLSFLLINLADLIYAFTNYKLLEHLGIFGDAYRLLADIANVAIIVGILAMAFRRFILRPATLSTRETTLLNPKARTGIMRDSAIVATFIFVHNTMRFLGESFGVALAGHSDRWQPSISAAAGLWSGVDASVLVAGEHIAFWLSIGAVVAFLPYFPYSKHIHLFFAPLNFALKPERKSIGELSYINLDDQSIEQFGAAKMKDLGWEQIMDSYACIMCFRCQEVCPAYNTGKLLSPAALEINKRYHFNGGGTTDVAMTELISEEAVWACTSCGACVDICPVGNEPMRDILDIRRNLSMMESAFPKQLETAFKGMERNQNPWNVSQGDRMKWAEGMNVPTIEQNAEPEILWWVGCAPATDSRAQKTAQAFAKILNTAGVNYAVLGKNESCTGDSARRAGREDIFFGLASQNVEILNEVAPKRIVTTCPHCLHTIKNEYPAFGGNYQVIHHTQLINELVGSGKISMNLEGDNMKITFHDPCYLGRHNKVTDAPRDTLRSAGVETVEMPRNSAKSFCCGAGGAQMWKEEEQGSARVNITRFNEAKATGASTVAVGCPFCLTMMTDAAKGDGGEIQVKDVAEIVAERLK
ncbi:MAG TPA: heterodisulfide reductase-related iron-sulfur binding cluster [Anaerolineales bacterium]|nr:heterodisulfide reductase-related iron-sulfur binding cluster [Anaerolineales bacterium]HMX74217.1 heterodisulfide reductase-related iron-sulfur binding cluster [Anaerolineales bacterium]HNA55800.1 heterodisulfide reductase-related iron-sulfur binding cluster [Anaerolineales bacterium]HNB86956.1 heterodisulfide reductase-related iron-sulfur binding cluster [Anaerolineales bacterium]HNC88963.1 heterodisulfide reductase-related iron-sulfur binding cluster [Anaerolineales bacterium]